MKLGELIAPSGKRAGAETAPVYSVTKHHGFVRSDKYFTKRVFSDDLSSYKLVQKGDFAYATIHLDEGSIGRAPESALISPMYTVFTVDDSRVDPGYLLRYMKSPIALQRYATLGRGTAERRKSISLDSLGRLDVPLPPLPEQRRIAAILDEADALRTKRRESLELFEALAPTRVSELIKTHQSAETRRLGEVAEVQGGLTVNARRSSNPVTAEYLRVANVFRGRIDLTEVKTIGVTEAEVERVALRQNDLLVVEGHGNEDEVGRVARWVESSAPMVHQNHLIRVRVIEGFEPAFVEHYLNSTAGRRYFRSVAKTTSGLNTINVSSVRAVPIPDVPLSGQRAFADEIAALHPVREWLSADLRTLDTLFASLQHRAFTGRL